MMGFKTCLEEQTCCFKHFRDSLLSSIARLEGCKYITSCNFHTDLYFVSLARKKVIVEVEGV